MMTIVLETSNIFEGQEEAGAIGEVREKLSRLVLVDTVFGGTWLIDMLVGDSLPRICQGKFRLSGRDTVELVYRALRNNSFPERCTACSGMLSASEGIPR